MKNEKKNLRDVYSQDNRRCESILSELLYNFNEVKIMEQKNIPLAVVHKNILISVLQVFEKPL